MYFSKVAAYIFQLYFSFSFVFFLLSCLLDSENIADQRPLEQLLWYFILPLSLCLSTLRWIPEIMSNEMLAWIFFLSSTSKKSRQSASILWTIDLYPFSGWVLSRFYENIWMGFFWIHNRMPKFYIHFMPNYVWYTLKNSGKCVVAKSFKEQTTLSWRLSVNLVYRRICSS